MCDDEMPDTIVKDSKKDITSALAYSDGAVNPASGEDGINEITRL